jgi:hypothetical protein
MPHVAALYRYPLKGFTPEPCDTVTVRPDGRIAGDRVLGVRLADNPAGDSAWSPKAGMLVLMNTPGLARLQVRYDAAGKRLWIALDGAVLADEALDAAGRSHLAAVLADYALSLPESPLKGRTDRLPLRIAGDGETPRFHDAETGEVTLHGRGSLAAVAQAFGDPGFSELRFRSNIAVEGLEPWEELAWVGRTVRIGSLLFDVTKDKGRCLATHANPSTGERDRQVMTTLTQQFGQQKPTFAVSLRARAGGLVRLGDPVEPE